MYIYIYIYIYIIYSCRILLVYFWNRKTFIQDFPSCLAPLTSLDCRPKKNFEKKKVSPIAFRQKFYLKICASVSHL